MAEARSIANESVAAYRSHGDLDRVYAEAYGIYGDLLKFSAYYLGNLAGRATKFDDRPDFASQITDHWFEPFFKRLHVALDDIASNYGRWKELTPFEVIGDIADDVVSLGGIQHSYLVDGRLYPCVP